MTNLPPKKMTISHGPVVDNESHRKAGLDQMLVEIGVTSLRLPQR
jgi:hypothetical protein